MDAKLRKADDLPTRTTDDGRKVALVRKGRLDCYPEDDRGFALLEVAGDLLTVIGEAPDKASADRLLQRAIWCDPRSPKV